jgi:hypothetical protein
MLSTIQRASCFVTHVQRNGTLLQVWLQKEHDSALAIEKELKALKSGLRYLGNVPKSMADLRHGLVCCSRYEYPQDFE